MPYGRVAGLRYHRLAMVRFGVSYSAPTESAHDSPTSAHALPQEFLAKPETDGGECLHRVHRYIIPKPNARKNRMLIIDGDYPMATGALFWDRDLSWELSRIRTAERGIVKNGGWPDAYAMASLPEMRKAQIAAALVKVCLVCQAAGPSARRVPHPEPRLCRLHGPACVLSTAGVPGRSSHPGYPRGVRLPRGRLVECLRLLRVAGRLRDRHGGCGRDRVARAGPRVVGQRPACRQPVPLRFQRVLSRHRHGHRRRPLSAGQAAARRDGQARHDPGRIPHVRRVGTRRAGDIRRTAARQPSTAAPSPRASDSSQTTS